MSNLSRKVKKATEPFEDQAKRAQKKYEARVRALSTSQYPWPNLTDAKIRAFDQLPDEEKDKVRDKNGVYDLDAVQYELTISWRKSIGWFPVVRAYMDEKTNKNSDLTSE